MTETNQLNLRFFGNNISPSIVRARDLAQVIIAYEAAIAATAAANTPGTKPEEFTIALVQIHDASVGLEFGAPLEQPVLRAAHALLTNLNERAWGKLPGVVLSHIANIIKFAKQYECTALLETRYGEQTAKVVFASDTVIPAPAILRGETELVGQVRRVGGDEPKVAIRLLHGDTLYCPTTEEIAKQLGNYLYEQVQVAGIAVWDADTLNITEFVITEFVAHFDQSPSQAFRQIRERVGYVLERIDNVEAWVQDLRNG